LGDINAQAEPPQMQNEILKDYVSREQLAANIGKSTKTLIRWELDGRGPPVTRIGRDVLYYLPSIEKWLRSQEKAAA
jgi:predicted DNA-binding transcriptional regulator AlpA